MNVKHLLAETIYLIHTCPKRKDFVDNYLVPALKLQGIESSRIFIYNDTQKLGNLQAYIKAADIISGQRPDIQIVHLQDDIIPCSTFKEVIETNYKELYDVDVVCGFNSQYDNANNFFVRKAVDSWFSFQCIKFSNKMLQDFVFWIKNKGQYLYKNWYDQGKYDDSFFKEYIQSVKPNPLVLNLNPTIVQCVDDIIGGSVINNSRGFNMKSSLFLDGETIGQFMKDYRNNVTWKDKLNKNEYNISYKLSDTKIKTYKI